MILAFFGAAWILAGLAVSHRSSTLATSAVCACAVVLAAVARLQLRRRPPVPPAVPFNGRLYGIVNVAQWVAIFGVAALLPALGLRDWVIPVSIAIVGLHFLPLARSFDSLYYATGAAMVLLAFIYPFVPSLGPKSAAGLFGAGVILWATAVVALGSVRGRA